MNEITGGYLSSVNSAFEQAYIYLTMKQNNADAIWIGLNDVKVTFLLNILVNFKGSTEDKNSSGSQLC